MFKSAVWDEETGQDVDDRLLCNIDATTFVYMESGKKLKVRILRESERATRVGASPLEQRFKLLSCQHVPLGGWGANTRPLASVL